ncbi:glucose-6-phosphate dehydrogenase [Pseudokineococcus lusitanus]|uniref:Glucose-6-phosphate 1-dehydrogenase n=1 Tax=Pseudokineococcus lusitanus TaxID=763993 RepID=A0A3N1HSB4_9ACTN|nr:glucose-6-phosphate dehydrogenase [Pseudokineococcus lusitanus]ROP45434.1 glucose-6-phosphate 1-dehydrogenase [Pseudokineococcus lusitanus]
MTTLVVLGAGGDLASRLLLPGLADLLSSGDVPGAPVRLVGADRAEHDDAWWHERVRAAVDAAGATGAAVDELLATTRYEPVDVTAEGGLAGLLARAARPDGDGAGGDDGDDEQVVCYFALPPEVTGAACRALDPSEVPDGLRLVLEKPFGHDHPSSVELDAVLRRLVPEERVHRVDHFLGKSTVLNVLGLRFANRLLENSWTARDVERVDVVFDEDLALEGRAGYYDHAGALVDMVQSHLLQLLALLAMDPPATVSERDLRDRKAEVLRATRLWDPEDPAACTRRARWTAGRLGDREVGAYADSDGVDPDRGTETLAEVVLAVDTWRWAGVPFRLRSGKALGTRRKEAVVTFRHVPHLPTGLLGTPSPTRLRIGFGPDDLTLELDVNGEDDAFTLERTSLTTQLSPGSLSAYAQVLHGVLAGDPTLSVRGDIAEECWRVVDPVLAAWRGGRVPLEEYPAGSGGPRGTGLLEDVDVLEAVEDAAAPRP